MSRQALLVGSGGHARVVLSLLAASGSRPVLGLLDIGTTRPGEVIMGVPVIGAASMLAEYGGRDDVDVYLAIGDNASRRDWWSRVQALGLHLPSLVSPHAIVDPTSRLADGVVVCARAFVGPEATVGENTLLNTACIVEHEVTVGRHCHLAPSATVAGRSRIGHGCFIGAGATVIDRVSIADNVIVGAGGTVVRSIEAAGGVYVGVPAARRGAAGTQA